MYQIGEVAACSGLPPDTLRYYERIGLLPPPARTSGGFRVYPPQVLDRLRFIKQAQALGLTLQEIRDLLAYQDHGGLERCRKVRDLLQAKLEELQQKLSELEQFRAVLSRHLDECERALAAGRSKRRANECPVVEALTRSK
jgi:MerR family mercuric resistance operon transcriptional regulator